MLRAGFHPRPAARRPAACRLLSGHARRDRCLGERRRRNARARQPHEFPAIHDSLACRRHAGAGGITLTRLDLTEREQSVLRAAGVLQCFRPHNNSGP
jgi:hypothetical protein